MNRSGADELVAIEKSKQKNGRAARVVAAVHAATLDLLEKRGYDGMEIPEIAERAQVNKTSIYRRWPSKLELLLDVALAKLAVTVSIDDMGSLHAELTALLTMISSTLSTPLAKGMIRAFVVQDQHDEHVKQARIAFWDARFRASGAIVERAIQRGELPKSTQIRDFLECAASPVFYRVLISHEPMMEHDIQRIVEQTCRAFGSGKS
ncbi:MAG: TetR/AcrR family transcriptional regulator [Gammaproteobacteria bacterium]|nr:TetR/AcrR family transcriptional regulator [Gammaproteobacteria bacterium]